MIGWAKAKIVNLLVNRMNFDLILGSVHFLDLWPFDDPAQRGYWDEVGPDYIWRRYFEVWCEAVMSDVPFTVMSHPDW